MLKLYERCKKEINVFFFLENAWDKRRLDRACEQLGIERNKRGGNHK